MVSPTSLKSLIVVKFLKHAGKFENKFDKIFYKIDSIMNIQFKKEKKKINCLN